MRQINWHFWDIKKDFIEQNNHSLCNWDPLDCKKMKIFKGKWFILAIFEFCDTCAGYEFMLMQEVGEVLSSDDQEAVASSLLRGLLSYADIRLVLPWI